MQERELQRPLGQGELDDLSEFLSTAPGAMPFSEAHGFLTAIASVPTTMMPSVWQPIHQLSPEVSIECDYGAGTNTTTIPASVLTDLVLSNVANLHVSIFSIATDNVLAGPFEISLEAINMALDGDAFAQ